MLWAPGTKMLGENDGAIVSPLRRQVQELLENKSSGKIDAEFANNGDKAN